MYETYWQLRQKPFEPGANTKFYYPGESHQAALLKLRYAIENRRGGALLAGPSGVGKTLLANMLREMLGENFKPFVQIVFPQMSTPELLAYLADEMEGKPGDFSTPSVQTSIQRIQHFLAANLEQGRHTVVVIDESHLIDDPATFEAVRLLMNFEIGGHDADDRRSRCFRHAPRTDARLPQADQSALRLGVIDRLRRRTRNAHGRAFRVDLPRTRDRCAGVRTGMTKLE